MSGPEEPETPFPEDTISAVDMQQEEPAKETPSETPAEQTPLAPEPKKRGRKKTEIVAEPAVPRKPRATRKKTESVVITAVDVTEPPQPPTSTPEGAPETEAPALAPPTFASVQQSMSNLQAEFRRLRRESKQTHYRKLLEGKI